MNKLVGVALMALMTAGCVSADRSTVGRESGRDVWVLCRFDLKSADVRADYLAKTKEIMDTVRAEPGCLGYTLVGDAVTDWEKPQRFGEKTLWMIEHWESIESLKSHLAAPHMKAFGPTVRPLRASGTFHVLEDVFR